MNKDNLGQRINLSKAENMKVRLAWTSTEKVECDLMAFMLDETGVIPTRWDIIFYNVHRHESRSVEQLGIKADENGGRDEIRVVPDKIPEQFKKIMFLACVYEGAERNQDLTSVGNLTLTITNEKTGDIIFQYPALPAQAGERSVILGELVRENDVWQYQVIDQKDKEQLVGVIATHYGMRVDWRSDYKNITGVN